MTEDKKRILQERIAELHEKYCKQLPGKYQEIENSWNRYHSDLSNPDYLEEFYRLIHTLKGTAGTFGFVKQADSCLTIQKLLMDVKENQSQLSDASVAGIQNALDELKANIDKPTESTHD